VTKPIWSSPYGQLDGDLGMLPDLVLAAAVARPDRAALVDAAGGAVVPYGVLASRIDRVAAGLAASGFRPGEVLALLTPNVPPWAGLALGAMRAGGAVTGVGPAATDADLARQLGLTGAAVLVTTPSRLPAARPPGVREILVLGDTPTGARAVTDLIGSRASAPELRLYPGRTALLPCSSGTTGLPKAVVLTHANLAAGVAQIRLGLGLTPDDVVLSPAPYAHVMGFVGALAAPLAAGATVVTLPRFDLPALLAAIERHRVTVLVVPPPVAAAVADSPRTADLASLRLVVCGGAPLTPELQGRLAERLPGVVVGQGYGMTETTLPIPIPDPRAGTPPGSAGRLAPGTELRVVDPDTGLDQGPGQPGELWVRGPQVTPGYLGDRGATAALFAGGGWLRTGDLGLVDPDGYVVVVDRLKELIKVNALQVAPAELEALLLTRPDVADAAVVGRPDPRTGEVPVAVVVPRGELDPDELRCWAAARVAPHKRLAEVLLTDRIPRTPSGKILRRELRSAVPVLAG
jgi:acyl-CoA synthetase (AMP-forming)/AMP-acid ligase II